MNESTNTLDLVAILKDIPEDKIEKGFVGTVVEKYSSGYYEVEFSDEDGQTIAFAELKSDEFVILRNLSLVA